MQERPASPATATAEYIHLHLLDQLRPQDIEFSPGVGPFFTHPGAGEASPAAVRPEVPQQTAARNNKRRAPAAPLAMSAPVAPTSSTPGMGEPVMAAAPVEPPPKKSRTNTPWTPAEELRLKNMRDAGNSWAEIAKSFPTRTEGSVKKHWYKDMHYAEFAEDESQALLNAIKEYETNKWKVIGAKVGKPAKACEQYAKEHFAGRI